MFQDLRNLHETSAQEPYQNTGQGDEDDGARPDKPIGLGRNVEDGRELVHKSDDPDAQPRKPHSARTVIGEKAALLQEQKRQPDQEQIQCDQDHSIHAISGYSILRMRCIHSLPNCHGRRSLAFQRQMFHFQGQGDLFGERFQKVHLLRCQGSPPILWAQGEDAKQACAVCSGTHRMSTSSEWAMPRPAMLLVV